MMKYLIFFTAQGMGFHCWLGEQSHADTAKALGAVSVRSAGFIRLGETGSLECEGFSESLGIAARSTDSALANRFFKQTNTDDNRSPDTHHETQAHHHH